MINTVTIPIAEYDFLRKQSEEVLRLKEIKEPQININVDQSYCYEGRIITNQLRCDSNILPENLENILDEIVLQLKEEFANYNELEQQKDETEGKLLKRLNSEQQRCFELNRKLNKIPKWIRRIFE